MVQLTAEIVGQVRATVNRQRLIETVRDLVAVPSPTGDAGKVADRLAVMLSADGFAVERPVGGHPAAPAVVARLESGQPGLCLQFNGHLDVVHLPFVPPGIDGDHITGSGACDMKGGLAAAIEALRVLQASKLLAAGSVLLTAHDLHEAPWGLGQQLDGLIKDKVRGDAVLIPEPLSDRLPVAGRGAATWKATIRRSGPPVHEVMRPPEEPSVIAAGARLVDQLGRLDRRLARKQDPVAGAESLFIGQIHSGEIYNQYPQECWIEGTRRWLPATKRSQVKRQLEGMFQREARKTGTTIACEFKFIRDAFWLNPEDPVVSAFQAGHTALSGATLPAGPKPFVDDGNSFWGLARLPAITHGPRAGGQHTLAEWVSIDDLVRVAAIYALTAIAYCANSERPGGAGRVGDRS